MTNLTDNGVDISALYVSPDANEKLREDEAMIERVALAICYEANYSLFPLDKREREFMDHKPYYISQAKAAIKAVKGND